MADKARYLREDDPDTYKVDNTGTISVGDWVKWDTSALEALRQATGAALNCIGVSESRIPISSGMDPDLLKDTIRVKRNGVFTFKTTAAEVYKHGETVGVGADSQTVTKTVTANNITGKVWLPGGETVTGAAGVEVAIDIKPLYVQ